ncbi:hypothetical protein [Magnetofaba australis]|uniref:Uncharacterized protein n=1 Tax=Magnetofaba australis IT-1 TaxID=1434232 RepID=A0A1Y2K0H4_9PROT|nr:hypothetical protein [Magnetofaba australis]OSM00243.1 hypothetical protein MAIT1_00711 [Magnetofaba australis IT-1]
MKAQWYVEDLVDQDITNWSQLDRGARHQLAHLILADYSTDERDDLIRDCLVEGNMELVFMSLGEPYRQTAAAAFMEGRISCLVNAVRPAAEALFEAVLAQQAKQFALPTPPHEPTHGADKKSDSDTEAA